MKGGMQGMLKQIQKMQEDLYMSSDKTFVQ